MILWFIRAVTVAIANLVTISEIKLGETLGDGSIR
jgi:hypothetical protein